MEDVFSRCLTVNSSEACASPRPPVSERCDLTSPHQRGYSKMCFPLLCNTSARRVNRFCSRVYFHFLTSSSNLVYPSFVGACSVSLCFSARGAARVEQEEEDERFTKKDDKQKIKQTGRSSSKFHLSLRLPLSL